MNAKRCQGSTLAKNIYWNRIRRIKFKYWLVVVEGADKWPMQFNIIKCKVMRLGQKNPRFLCTMRCNGLQIVEVEKDLGVMISSVAQTLMLTAVRLP